MEKIPPLIIRADAHTSIGIGHVMRCLALAQVRRAAGGKVFFVMAMDAGSLFERLKREGMEIRRIQEVPASLNDAVHTADIAKKEGAKWVILDGYDFTPDYQKVIKDAGFQLIVVDDNHDQNHYYADIILNNNIYANARFYPRDCLEPYTRLFLGPSYYLLREEFVKTTSSSCPEIARRLLVTMGGSDPHNVTQKILEAIHLLDIPAIEIKVVIGDNNPHYFALCEYCTCFRGRAKLLRHVENMAEVMSWADFAIAAAGNTCYELSYMTVPFLTVVVAENQTAFADSAHRLGICQSLGWYNKVSVGQIAAELRQFAYDVEKRQEQKEKQEYLRSFSFNKAWLVNLEKEFYDIRKTES